MLFDTDDVFIHLTQDKAPLYRHKQHGHVNSIVLLGSVKQKRYGIRAYSVSWPQGKVYIPPPSTSINGFWGPDIKHTYAHELIIFLRVRN